MKNICVFHLLCFVFSFPLYAQDTCTDAEIEVNIADIIWNATATDLDDGIDTPFYGELPTGTFHVVQLDFVPSPNFQEYGYTFDFDLSIIKSNKPVVLLFDSEIGNSLVMNTPPFVVVPLLDADMVITGFHIWRLDTSTMGGVATSAGLMLRESSLASPCIDISLENRGGVLQDGTSCNLEDELLRECRVRNIIPSNILQLSIGKKEAQSSPIDVNIYPIPSKNNVFIDVYDLEINKVQIIDMQGKTQDHRASIRYGTDRIQINNAQLEVGIYWLKMETPEGVVCRKIVIQR